MKNKWLTLTAIIFLVFIFISSCKNDGPTTPVVAQTHTPGPVNTATPDPALTPACSPINLSFTEVATTTCSICSANTGIIINSQADYDANYTGPALAPIDFAKNTLIGFPANLTCGIAWTLTSVTSDCRVVYLNFSKTYCVWCNVVMNNELYYLIDKTTLPIDVITASIVCGGTPTVSAPSPLVN